MKLVLRAYLSMLKESRELDVLIPDLCLAMGVVPVTRAQIGVDQHGVDFAAIGRLPGKDRSEVLLFVIKQGDMDRGKWQGSPQAVRPTLDDVLDDYISHCLTDELREMPTRIVLIFGGEMRQNVISKWTGFVNGHARGDRAFEYWDGNKIAAYLHDHLVTEFLFPEEL